MPKTISQENFTKAARVIDSTVAPRIQKIVNEVNKFFAKDGIRAGVEVKWFFDEVGEPEAKRLVDEDIANG